MVSVRWDTSSIESGSESVKKHFGAGCALPLRRFRGVPATPTAERGHGLMVHAKEAMKICDLFSERHVEIVPRDERWIVSLVKHSNAPEFVRTYDTLADAVDAAHDLLLVLVDDTELVPDWAAAADARNRLRDLLARHAAGEPWQAEIEVAGLRDWYLRQMGEG